jgi:hypothetical protein
MMRIRQACQAALCFVLSPLLVAQQIAATSATVRLPKDTEVDLKLDQDVSSATIHEGEQVRYVVVDDVAVDGVIVIPTGTAVYEKVEVAQPAALGKRCGDENNGWFNLSDTARLSSHGVQMKMKAWRQSDLPSGPQLTPKEKVLEVVAAPLQIPALAVLVAAPVVLIPIGIASGIHDLLHRPPLRPQGRAALQSPMALESPQAPAELELQAPQLLPLSPPPPQTPVVSQSPTVRQALQETQPLTAPQPSSSTITLPLLNAPQPRLPATLPCKTKVQDEVWKASEAGVKAYYLVRDYTLETGLPPGPANHDAKKEVQ